MSGQGTPHGRLLARSAQAFDFAGEVVGIDLSDGPVAVVVYIDEHEHERRTRAGLGAITDREVVTALWELPHATPIERSVLPSWVHPLLDRAPEGAVSTDGSALTRANQPPLNVSGALAVGRNLEHLVRRVGQLSAVAPMAVVLQGDVDQHDPWLLNASLYGMGVAQSRSGTLAPISMPASVTPTLGAYRWWICELAYAQLIEHTQQAGSTVARGVADATLLTSGNEGDG